MPEIPPQIRQIENIDQQQEAGSSPSVETRVDFPAPPAVGPIADLSGVGQVFMPVPGGTFWGGLGEPRPNGRKHRGLDIGAERGSPVVAPVSGTIIYAERRSPDGGTSGYGVAIAIRDSEGNKHALAHLDSSSEVFWQQNGFKPGMQIEAGQLVGFVGNTGDAIQTPPHLHYSINEDTGVLYDPQAFLEGALVAISDLPESDSNDTALPRDDLTPEELEQAAREEFPALATYLSIPELGDIILTATKEGWTTEKLLTELQNTDWWKSNSKDIRARVALKAEDPATFADNVRQFAKTIRGIYIQYGLAPPAGNPNMPDFEGTALYQLAEDFYLANISETDVAYGVGQSIGYVPKDSTSTGVMADKQAEVRALARDYGVTLSEEESFGYAKKIVLGDMTDSSLQDFFRDLAISRFSYDKNFSSRLKEGFTVSQLMSAHRENIARLLEVDPDSVNWNDPKFAPILDGVDGNGERRVMTVTEARRYVRRLPEAKQTANFRQDAARLAEYIGKTFGVVR